MTWEEVRNIIIKIDNASRLSDVYKQNKNRMWGQSVQPKTCRACGKKGHMVAACTVPKEKLYCKHCNMKSSHNTSACLKKQKEKKERKKTAKTWKKQKQEKPLTFRERKETSEERCKRDLSNYRKNSGSPVALHNSCAQLQMMGSILSGGLSWRYTLRDPHPPLREVRLPQLYQPPSAEGCCLPRSDSLPR